MSNKEKVLNLDLFEIKCEFPYVNSGGCGWVAFHISRNLDKLGVDHEICLVSPNSVNVRELNLEHQRILSSEEMGWYTGWWEHVVVRVDDYILDGSGIFERDGYSYAGYTGLSIIDKEILSEWLEEDTWNYTFEEEYNVEDVECFIDNLFNI